MSDQKPGTQWDGFIKAVLKNLHQHEGKIYILM